MCAGAMTSAWTPGGPTPHGDTYSRVGSRGGPARIGLRVVSLVGESQRSQLQNMTLLCGRLVGAAQSEALYCA